MRFLLAFCFLFVPTGCEAQHDEDRSTDDRTVEARAVNGDKLLNEDALPDETIAIVTTDDRFRLSLTDFELRMGVTEAFVEQIEDEVSSEVDESSGFGRMLSGAISGAMRGALTNQIAFDLADIRDVTYADGRLDIDFEGEQNTDKPFGDISVDGQDFAEMFSPSDARAFADAFSRAKRR